MIVEAVCASCTEHGPVAIFATLADGTQLALCRSCSEIPERAQAFVARYHAGRKLPGTAHPVASAPPFQGASDCPADRAAD